MSKTLFVSDLRETGCDLARLTETLCVSVGWFWNDDDIGPRLNDLGACVIDAVKDHAEELNSDCSFVKD